MAGARAGCIRQNSEDRQRLCGLHAFVRPATLCWTDCWGVPEEVRETMGRLDHGKLALALVRPHGSLALVTGVVLSATAAAQRGARHEGPIAECNGARE